jgi:hypothetical protein
LRKWLGFCKSLTVKNINNSILNKDIKCKLILWIAPVYSKIIFITILPLLLELGFLIEAKLLDYTLRLAMPLLALTFTMISLITW